MVRALLDLVLLDDIPSLYPLLRVEWASHDSLMMMAVINCRTTNIYVTGTLYSLVHSRLRPDLMVYLMMAALP